MFIPDELLRIQSWCLADPYTKYPFSAIDNQGIKHEPTDKLITAYEFTPEQRAAISEGRLRPGFVLKKEHNITVIDIDGKHYNQNPERFNKLMGLFNTYTERSQSGQGFHVWVKGTLQESGRRFNELEIYCDKRYIMVTGDAVNPVGLLDGRQGLLDELIATAPKQASIIDFQLVEVPPQYTDEQVIEKASSAANGEKFAAMFLHYKTGDHTLFKKPSQSEVDDALLEMLCNYTPSNEQVMRLFKQSKLYRPHLHNKGDNYIRRSIARSRNRQEEERKVAEALLHSATNIHIKPKPSKPYDIPQLGCPPGFVGYLAQQMQARAQNIVPCAAYVSALAMVTGLVSGGFVTPTEAGLNGYYVVMSLSGIGKDLIFTTSHDIIEQIKSNNALNVQLRGKLTDYLDFSIYGSARALFKNLTHNNRLGFTHYNREFGEDFTELCTMRYDAPQVKEARRIFTSLFTIGRIGNVVYSDKENNVEGNEKGCAYTTIGDAIASNVFDFLNEKALRSGLLSRFTFVEYEGEAVTNQARSYAPYPLDLLQYLVDLLNCSIEATAPKAHNFNPQRVSVSMDAEAIAIEQRFRQLQLDQIKGVEQEAYRQKWIRQHEKALRVASVLAVADNHTYAEGKVQFNREQIPIIRAQHMQWAIDLMMHSLNVFEKREEAGEVGDVEAGHDEAVKRLISLVEEILQPGKHYKDENVNTLAKFSIISHAYLVVRSAQLSVFRKSKTGNLLRKGAIEELVNMGKLVKITVNTLKGFENSNGIHYKYDNR